MGSQRGSPVLAVALELQAERKRAFLLCDLSPASGVMAQSQIIARLADQGWPVGVCQLTMATLACALDNWESALDGLDELRNSHELLPGYGTFVNLMSLLCKVHLGTRPGSALTSIPEGLELTGHSERESRALVSLLHAEGAAAMEGDPEKKREIASTYAARPGRVDLSPLLGHLATAFLRRSGHVAPA